MIDALLKEVLAGELPVFMLLAGPHGAGKTTFRERILDPFGFHFVNPDELSLRRLGGHASNEREALQSTLDAETMVRMCLVRGESVGLESVFSDQDGHKLRLLDEARQQGFRTILIFIGLNSAELSLARVMQRVDDGGHNVEDQAITTRYLRCFDNLKRAIGIVDLTLLYDNSSSDLRHRRFAAIDAAGTVHLTPPCPYWYGAFEISQAIPQRLIAATSSGLTLPYFH